MTKNKAADIPAEIRKIMNTHKHLARTTESESVAEANLSVLMGYLGYAVVSGAISACEHSEEWSSIRMIRDEREARRRLAA